MKKIIKLLFISIFAIIGLLTFLSFNNRSTKVNATAQLSDGQTLDTVVQVISISDLTYNGNSGQNELTGNKNTSVTFADFNSSNPNKNLIFIFKYDLKDNTPGSPNNDTKNLRIHMDVSDDEWNKNCSFMIRPDNMFLRDANTDKWLTHSTLASGKTYIVEFGRIAILDSKGTATGKYYVYYKIDGVEYDSVINTYNLAKMDNSMFINIGAQHSAENRILDAYGKEDPKYVDVNDLSSSPITIAASENQTFTFDNDDHKPNYSLIFRFKYTFNDANQNQVHISGSDKWGKGSSFTLGNNSGTKVRLGKTKADGTDDGWEAFDYELTVGQTYEIEYGRIANVCGSYLLGTYDCYLKIDGTIVATINCVLNPTYASDNKVFITADGANTFTDNTPSEVAEIPDIISVSDLMLNNELVGKTTVMNNKKSYSYNANAEHRSLIYKANYEVDELLTGSNGYLQLCFGPAWCSNAIWLRADNTYIKKDESGYVQVKKAFPAVGTYELEFGKIYIIEGKHEGMYHLYVKVNGEMLAEYYTNNSFVNNNLFNNKEGANQTWSDICADGHTLGAQVAAVPSTCSIHGTLAYYECEICGKKFADQTGNQKLDSIVAPLGKHDVFGDECSICHAKANPNFITANGTKIMFINPIQLWKYNNAKVSFDSSYSSLVVDLVSPNKANRVSEKKTLVGTEVIGLTGVFYHYEFYVQDFALNNSNGYDTLDAFRFRDEGDYANLVVTNDEALLEDADEISVGDLSYLDGKTCGKIVTFDVEKKFQYVSTTNHASVVFSYKYTVDEIPSSNSYSFGQIHFSNGYSSNSLWIRNDKTYIKKDDGETRVEGDRAFTEAGTKTITFGKVYISSGEFAGKYYLFVRANGVTIAEYITSNDYLNNNIYCTLSDGTSWVDIDYIPNEYETADEISVGDLYLNDKEVPNFITLDIEKEYTYEASAINKSVIFKFMMTVDTIPNQNDYDYGQYYFDTVYGRNGLWLKNDGTYIYTDNNTVIKGTKAFATSGTKIIEIGKVYVTYGEDAGKYRLYVKADNLLLVEYFSSNKLTSEKVSTTGKDQRVITIPNFTACTDSHSLKHFAAVDSSCYVIGNIEYNWCKNCNKYFAADGISEITDLSTIEIPMTHEFGNLVVGNPATCDQDGTYSYYECSLCHNKYAEDKTTKLETIVESAHHTLTHFTNTLATCDSDGNEEYWYCEVCKKYFLDETCSNETTKEEVTIPAKHELSELIEAIKETCTTNGNVAYYHCSECGKNFADEECTIVLDKVIIEKHHSYVFNEAIEATCLHDGKVEYYECSVCHKIVDAQGCSIVDLVISKLNHNLNKTDAVSATCEKAGNKEYWTCEDCGKKFSDKDGTTEITNVIVAPKGHQYVDGKCQACGASDPNYKKKGCKSSISIYNFISIFSLLAIALIIKKKEYK